jgi:hypothetical protein
MDSSLKKIQLFAEAMRVYRKSISYTKLPNIMINLFKRFDYINTFNGFNYIKSKDYQWNNNINFNRLSNDYFPK